ncbi:FkbM family methyltransferase [Gemmobacter denitrificans]|uniref:FkbM family methyltransferase n=1 Tax=Gemmobacter denitrificans TaxID=3123040 RepID=A0ABU8BZD4_9RHOB
MLNLSPKQQLHLAAHNLVARLGLDGLRPLRITPEGEGYRLDLEGDTVLVPSALLWRSYRRGWVARLDRLAREFGLDQAAPFAPDEAVIDMGANVGDFTAAALRAGAPRVLALDGDPKVAACLRANRGADPRVAVDCAILWKAEEIVTFYSAPGKADSSIFLPPGTGSVAFEAQATTLDVMAARHGIGRVGLFKMDAEGAEPEVLQGASALLARTRMVAIDTGPERNGARTDAACIEILTAAGFRITNPGDGKRKITMAINASCA